MIHEIDKLTPLIYELKHYEEMAKALETNETSIRIRGSRDTMEYGLTDQVREKAQKAIHSIVAVEVRRLQKKLARAFRGLNA